MGLFSVQPVAWSIEKHVMFLLELIFNSPQTLRPHREWSFQAGITTQRLIRLSCENKQIEWDAGTVVNWREHSCQEWEGRVGGEERVPEWGTMLVIFMIHSLWVAPVSWNLNLLALLIFLPGAKWLCCWCVVFLLICGREVEKPVHLVALTEVST